MGNKLTQERIPKTKKETFLFINNYIKEQEVFCKRFTELYIQDQTMKELEPELKKIFSFKLNARLIQFIWLHIFLCMSCANIDKNNKLIKAPYDINFETLFNIIKQIANDESKIFFVAIQKNNIKEVLQNAKNRKKQAIYKLVRWEKIALCLDFIVEEIAFASRNGDKVFFEGLADAIKQKVTDKRKIKNQLYKASLMYLIPFIKTTKDLKERQIWRMFNKNTKGTSISDTIREFINDDISSLDDIDYFVKFLKRNKITS